MKLFLFALFFFSSLTNIFAQKTDTAALKQTIIEQYTAGNVDSALVNIDSFLRTDSTNWEIWDVLTLIHLDQNDDVSTREAARKAATYAKNQAAAIYSKYGYEAFNTHKNLDLGIYLFREALALEPNSWQANAGLGVVYLQQENFLESRDVLKKCLETIPEEYAPELWVAYALTLHKSGDSKQATEYVQKALDKNGNPSIAYEVRAEIFKDTRQFAAAESDYAQMLTLVNNENGEDETSKAQIYNLRAFLYDAWGNHEIGAIADAKRARDGGIAQAYDSLALKYATPLDYLTLKVGSILRFRVNNEYNLDATVKAFSLSDNIVLEYTASTDSTSTGTVTIPQTAMERATQQHFFYSSEGETVLEDTTISFWVSRRALRELHNQRSTQLDPNESGELRTFNHTGTQSIAFVMDGKFRKVNALKATANQDGDEVTLWIFDQSSNPLILRMDAPMPMQLVEIVP